MAANNPDFEAEIRSLMAKGRKIDAYAANMIGYLGLEEYEPDLRELLRSRHPAVTNAAGRALEMIGSSADGGPSHD